MIDIARRKRIYKEFEIEGKVFAFDSTTIDLCLSVFWWAKFRRTKAGIKMHTLYEIQTDIPTFIHITEAKVHDQRAMDEIPYEQGAYYVFDRGYFDLKRLYHINEIEAYFVIRQRGNLQYEIINEGDTMHNADGVLSDQVIRLTNYFTKQKYPAVLRRVTYYAADKNKTFVYLTNNMEIPATQVALLYKYRWRVELFFYDKFIVMQSKVRSIPDNQMFVRLLLTSTSHNNSQCPRSLSQSRRSLLFSHSLSESRLGRRSAYAFSSASRLALESALA